MMIIVKNITDDDLIYIMENKDISEEIRTDDNNVLIIFTQDWCRDYKWLIREIEANKDTERYNVTIFICAYNNSPLFKKFKKFKENFWGNHFIPYLRFYKKGKLIKESNQMPLIRILRCFN